VSDNLGSVVDNITADDDLLCIDFTMPL